MNISGIVVTTAPECSEAVSEAINALGWARVDHSDDTGRLIATLEGETTEIEIERLKELKRLPGVLFAEMVVHCFEDEPTPPIESEAASQYLNDETTMDGRSFYQRLKALGNG